MSTRSQIGFYDAVESPITKPSMLLYRHSDGYPGSIEKDEYGVVPVLLPYLQKFKLNRGNDAEYQRARVTSHLMQEHDRDRESFLGYGIQSGEPLLHSDIEFYYAIFPDRLEVYSITWDTSLEDLAKLDGPLQTHPY